MSVRQVWRETTVLFWGYPALWLPVLGADLLSFALLRLDKYVVHVVIYHLLLGPPSVLTGQRSPSDPSHAVLVEATAIGGLLEWIAHFTEIVLYTAAFFMTAALVRTIRRPETKPFRSALQFVRSQWPAIFGVSMRVLGLLVIFAISFATFVAFTVPKYLPHWQMGITYTIVLPAFSIIACVVAPIAMRRIGAKELPPLTTESKKNGRIVSMLMVIVSSFLGYCLPFVARSFAAEPLFRNSTAETVLAGIGSLVTAVPYIVLFIALTLIVDHQVQSFSTPEADPCPFGDAGIGNE